MRHRSAFPAAAAENGGCGEIVEVQGGHIVRSTGRKDRHSKVCTAKGTRDRRVRLSAPTAIQFYDVQDRLGFDRPSKAVDWLIKKAKSAIDDLAELPPWNPVDAIRQAAAHAKPRRSKTITSPPARRTRGASVAARGSGEETEHQSSFLPASMDSGSIADTIKSFFPVVSSEAPPPQIIQQANYPPSDYPSRANTQNQDLRLSLQSFQNGPPFANQTEPTLFSGQSNPLGYDSSTTSWDHSQQNHHQSPEFERIQRLVTWNNGGAADSSAATGGGAFVFASPATTTTSSFQPVYGQSQLFSQRGPLQSINTPMIRAWFDPHRHHHHHQSINSDDLHHHHHHHHHIPPAIHQSVISGVAFASSGEFSGFRIPARFQGEEEENGGSKPSSASSDSRH